VREFRAGLGPRPRRKLTPVWPVSKTLTFVAPKSDPFGKSRPEGWDVFSRDGLWHYQRYETGARTAWRIVFLPTGQIVDGFGNVRDARAETAAGLSDRLAGAAFAAALRSRLDDEQRPQGHRQLAIHMRVAGKTTGSEADHRCVCGGFLAVVTSSGDLAHVDACDDCYTPGRGLPAEQCPAAATHRFCGSPLVAGIYPGCGIDRELCCSTGCRPQ
jgi:hypothetical protein